MRIPHTTQGLEILFLFCSGKGHFPQLACSPRVVESFGDSFGELGGVLAL